MFGLHSAEIFYTRFLTAVDFHQARALQLIRNYVKFRREMRGGFAKHVESYKNQSWSHWSLQTVLVWDDCLMDWSSPGTPPDYSWLKAGLGIVPFEDIRQ